MTTISTELFVESVDLTPEGMSERIRLRYDRAWYTGEPRGKTGKTFSTNSWQLVSTIETEENAEDMLNGIAQSVLDVLRRISGHEKAFKSVAAGQIAGFVVAISSETVPPLIFTPPMLRAISDLGVDLEIDLAV